MIWGLLSTGVVFLFVIIQIGGLFSRLKQIGLDAGYSFDHPYFEFIGQVKMGMFSQLMGAFLFSVAISAVGFLLLSHRIAGPISRLYSHLRQINESQKVTDIKFRKGDYIEDLAPILNEALKVDKAK
jgi:hypothetical protein